MLDFNTTINEVISTQVTAKTSNKQFVEYNSKKKLETSNLDKTVITKILELVNTFTFYVHISNKFVVITMYYSKTKSYGHYVLDCNTLQLAKVNSMSQGKKAVLEIVNNVQVQTQTQTVNVPKKVTPKTATTATNK